MISRLYGEPGGNKEVDPQWIGWNGERAHPRSPAGGGGPGYSSKPGPIGIESNLLAQGSEIDFKQQQDSTAIPLQSLPEATGSKKNPPPSTQPINLEKIKFMQNNFIDVDIGVEVVVDGKSDKVLAETSFEIPDFRIPGIVFDQAKKVSSFDGKFVWKGRISIQTFYASNVSPSDLSGYGRGTTKKDLISGDITLGFHENCHQLDYLAYLKNHPLPDPPKLAIGMKKNNYESDCERFKNEYNAFKEKMELDSRSRTDEVGYTLTEFKNSNKPFEHSSF